MRATVYDPAGVTPLYNVAVYVPNSTVDPIPTGASCETCATPVSGEPIHREVIAMTGPYGYLAYGTTYTGELVRAHLVGDLLLKCVLAFLALCLAAQTSGLRRWGWLGVIVVFLPNVADLFYDFAILTAALCLLTSKRREPLNVAAIVSAALLGFMGLMKGTNALVAFVALGVIIAQGLIERRSKRTLVISGIAAAVFFVGWLAAGQRIGHLPAYFRGIWELATGYNETMGLPSSERELATGLILTAGLTALLLSAAWSVRRDFPSLLTLLFLFGFTFLKWKHGFLRADGHVYILFNYAVLGLGAIGLAAKAQAGGDELRC